MKLLLILSMVVAMSSSSMAAMNTSSTPKSAMACKKMSSDVVYATQFTAPQAAKSGTTSTAK